MHCGLQSLLVNIKSLHQSDVSRQLLQDLIDRLIFDGFGYQLPTVECHVLYDAPTELAMHFECHY